MAKSRRLILLHLSSRTKMAADTVSCAIACANSVFSSKRIWAAIPRHRRTHFACELSQAKLCEPFHCHCYTLSGLRNEAPGHVPALARRLVDKRQSYPSIDPRLISQRFEIRRGRNRDDRRNCKTALILFGFSAVLGPCHANRLMDFVGHVLRPQRLARQAPDDRTQQRCFSRAIETTDEGQVFVYF